MAACTSVARSASDREGRVPGDGLLAAGAGAAGAVRAAISSRSSSTAPTNRAPTNAVSAGSVLNEAVVHEVAGAACVVCVVVGVWLGGGTGFSAPAGEAPCWALPMPPPLASAVDVVAGAPVVATTGALCVTVHVRSPLSS